MPEEIEQDVETIEYDNYTTSSEEENADIDEEYGKETKSNVDDGYNNSSEIKLEESNSKALTSITIENENNEIQTEMSIEQLPDLIRCEETQSQDIEDSNYKSDSNDTEESSSWETAMSSEPAMGNESDTSDEYKAISQSELNQQSRTTYMNTSKRSSCDLDSDNKEDNAKISENLDSSNILKEMGKEKINETEDKIFLSGKSSKTDEIETSEPKLDAHLKIIDVVEKSDEKITSETNIYEFDITVSGEILPKNKEKLEQKWALLDDEIIGENILNICHEIPENYGTDIITEKNRPNFFTPRIMIEEILDTELETTNYNVPLDKECLSDENENQLGIDPCNGQQTPDITIQSAHAGAKDESMENDKLNEELEGNPTLLHKDVSVEKEIELDRTVDNLSKEDRKEHPENDGKTPNVMLVKYKGSTSQKMEYNDINDTTKDTIPLFTENVKIESSEQSTVVERDIIRFAEFLLNPEYDNEEMHILRNERKQNNFVVRNVLELRRDIKEMEESILENKMHCNLHIKELKYNLQSNKNLNDLAIFESTITQNRPALEDLLEDRKSKPFIISDGYDELIKAHTENENSDDEGTGMNNDSCRNVSIRNQNNENTITRKDSDTDIEKNEEDEKVSISATLELQIAGTDDN